MKITFKSWKLISWVPEEYCWICKLGMTPVSPVLHTWCATVHKHGCFSTMVSLIFAGLGEWYLLFCFPFFGWWNLISNFLHFIQSLFVTLSNFCFQWDLRREWDDLKLCHIRKKFYVTSTDLTFFYCLAEIPPWWEVDIWARCPVNDFHPVADNCSSYCLLCMCCVASSASVFTTQCWICSFGGSNRLHYICQSFSLDVEYQSSLRVCQRMSQWLGTWGFGVRVCHRHTINGLVGSWDHPTLESLDQTISSKSFIIIY